MDFHDEDLRILTSLIKVVHKFSDLDEIYRVALDSVMELENIDMAMVYLVDEDRKEAILQAHRNLPEDYIIRASRIPYPKGVTWKVINSGTILNIEDIQRDLDIGPAGREMGPRGSLGIPIFLEEDVIGVIWFTGYKERKFNEREVSLLSTIGDQIAIAIAKAKREETIRKNLAQLSKKNRYEEIISAVTRIVHKSINLQEVLENAIESMNKNMDKVEHVSIFLVEGDDVVIKAHRGYPDWFIERVRRIPYPRGAVWKTIIEGKTRYVADIDKDTAIEPAGREIGTKSYLCMPIYFEGKAIGAVIINSLKKDDFDKEELNLLEIVVQQIEIAINSAKQAEALRKTREELEIRIEERTREIMKVNEELRNEIAERKQVEEELKKARDELGIKVEKRTAKISMVNARLRQEIIERRRIEETLLRSRDFYLKLFDEFPAMIWKSGTNAKCNYFNKSWLDFRGRTLDQEIEDGWAGRIHPDDLEDCLKTYINAFNTRRVFKMEYRLRRYDGEYRWVIDFGRPFYDLDGEFAGYIGSCYDITDRKRIEEERLKLDKLESLGVLAGGIAHDFNNMLGAILSTISVAKMDKHLEAESYNSLSEVERICIEAKRLTQQLLTFSKGGTPVKKLTSIEQIIRESASFALRGSNVRCESSIEDGLWDAEVDQGQIAQVISNLVINAQQSMPQGGVIKIKANNTELRRGFISSYIKEGNYVKITVEDHGIGIPKEHLSRIFDPYFTTKQKGSGLGLATAYSIIKSHGGFIDVESELGKGSRFYIYIPASEKRVLQRKSEGEKRAEARSRARVLIMDDEAIIRKSVGRALTRMGYDVEYATDGEEAIELYTKAREENRAFDLVIMDLTVPGGMGGREAIKRLRDIDPDVRAVVSSGYSNDPVMSEFTNYGFRGVISKPYTIEDLAETLRQVLNNQ